MAATVIDPYHRVMTESLGILAAAASLVAIIGGVVGLGVWLRRLFIGRKPLVVTSDPNHLYTQKDGSVVLGMRLEAGPIPRGLRHYRQPLLRRTHHGR